MPVSPDDAVTLAKGMLDLYAGAELRLLELIGQAVASGIDAPDWRERQLLAVQRLRAQTRKLLADLEQAATVEARDAILQAYNRGAALAGLDLGGTGAAAFGGVDPAAVQALTAATAGQLAATGLVIASTQDAIYRDVVSQVAGQALTDGLTRRQASARAMQTWADHGVTGFVDRAGRNWTMSAYAEMTMRTATAQAAVQGHTDRLTQAGNDLVMVSDAPEECARCRPWEGKVLSVGGQTPAGQHTEGNATFTVAGSVAQATAAGLFHPNCRHRLVLYIPGITRPLLDTADPEGDKLRQTQRYKERRIRQLRRREATAQASGDPAAAAKATGQRKAAQAEFAAWRKANDRKDLNYRTQVTPPPKPTPAPKAPEPIVKTQLTGSFAPKPPEIVKTQLDGSFAPKPAPIVKTQLSGSFEPKVTKTQLTGSFAPKPPAAKPITLADLKAKATKPPKAPDLAPPKAVTPPAPKASQAVPKPEAPPAATVTGARQFKSMDDGKRWASSVWPGPEGYDKAQLDAIRDYTGDGFEETNAKLRRTKGKAGSNPGLRSAFAAAPRVPEPITVVRANSQSTFGVPRGGDLSGIVGQTYTEHGYWSTSVADKSIWTQEPVQMRINVPAGTKGIYVSGAPGANRKNVLSAVGHAESELILDKGQQFVVRSARKVKGTWHVEADIIPKSTK